MTKCVIRKEEPADKVIEFWLEEGENTVTVCCSGGWSVLGFKPTPEGIKMHRYGCVGHREIATCDGKIAEE